jgi:hypothetical protein
MTTSYPSQDASAKKVSNTVSAKRTVKDIRNGELQYYAFLNHGAYFQNNYGAFSLHLLLTLHYNSDKGYAHPSLEWLEEHVPLKIRQIKNLLKIVKEARDDKGNLLWGVRRGYATKSGKNMANRYFPQFLEDVLVPKPVETEPEEWLEWHGYDPEEHQPADGDPDTLSPEPGLDASDDDEIDTQSLQTDEQPSFHDMFDSEEASVDSYNSDAFENDSPQGNESHIILPDTVYPDMESMKRFVRHMFNEIRLGVPSSHGFKVNHLATPATTSIKFARLPQSDRDFLNAFISYLSHLSHVDQETFNDFATALVRRWDEAKKPNAVFYLEYMQDYLKANPKKQ